MNRPRQSVALHELRGPAVIRLEGRALSRPAWIFLAGLLLCASCSPPKAPPVVPSAYEVDALKGDVALREVKQFLDVGPRVAGTAGARNAAHYLKERLIALGVAAEVDDFRDATPEGSNIFRKVMATLPGKLPGEVILAAHYDTKSGIEPFAGANDSGSGVGVLLALAPILKAGAAARPSARLAFLDGEECRIHYGPNDGLHGSRHLAAHLVSSGQARQVRAFILLDMVGDRDLTVTVPPNGSPVLIPAVFKAATEGGVRAKFSLAEWPVLDDHQPFVEAGIPAVDLIDFQYGSAPGLNDYWHTAADTLDKLGAGSLETVGRVVLRVLNGL